MSTILDGNVCGQKRVGFIHPHEDLLSVLSLRAETAKQRTIAFVLAILQLKIAIQILMHFHSQLFPAGQRCPFLQLFSDNTVNILPLGRSQ